MALARAELRAELEDLAEASARALERLRGGDEGGVCELVERRERLIGLLAGRAVETDEGVVAAAQRAVALDTELIAALRARVAGMGREVEDMTRTRRSLVSYGATTPAARSVFVERFG